MAILEPPPSMVLIPIPEGQSLAGPGVDLMRSLFVNFHIATKLR
jgi:hypothetical protein